jgi:hypothetical protein
MITPIKITVKIGNFTYEYNVNLITEDKNKEILDLYIDDRYKNSEVNNNEQDKGN